MRSTFHLMLAHVDHPSYDEVYRNARSRGDYIVMDNGAAENAPVSIETLINRAVDVSADEVVLPDVFFDCYGTLAVVNNALNQVQEYDLNFKFMAVVQGKSREDIRTILRAYENTSGIRVLGIPRHWIDTLDAISARVQILNLIEQRRLHEKFEVHLLGTSPLWGGELEYVSSNYPWVRSVDSSLPYNYAMDGKYLPLHGSSLDAEKAIWRPEGYFTKPQEIPVQALRSNIDTFLGWANATEGTRS